MSAPRIMIVEDEALVALMVEDLLTDFGCQISGSFGAVDEALACLDAAVPNPFTASSSSTGLIGLLSTVMSSKPLRGREP